MFIMWNWIWVDQDYSSEGSVIEDRVALGTGRKPHDVIDKVMKQEVE